MEIIRTKEQFEGKLAQWLFDVTTLSDEESIEIAEMVADKIREINGKITEDED